MFRDVLGRTVTVLIDPRLKRGHPKPKAPCVQSSRWRVQVPTPVPLSLVRILPRSFLRWPSSPTYPISSLFRGLASGPCPCNHRSRAVDDARSPTKPSSIQETRG